MERSILKKQLFELIETPTISGFEKENIKQISEKCLDIAGGFFDGYEVLESGSILFSRKCGLKNAKRLVLDAHIDTIGFIVSEIVKDGFVKVTNVGGVDPYILPACQVYIYGKKRMNGVFSCIPPHLATKNSDKTLKISDFYVDTGLSDEELREVCVVGTPCGFKAEPIVLENDIVASHSLDDKACVMAALTACSLIDKKALKSDIYVHLSVGEERNALGAKTLPYVLEADGCIVLDVNFAHTRDIKEYESLEMGKGAGVSYSATIKRELTDFVTSIAKKHNIPFQSVVEMRSTGTNATFMHKNAIACAVLSIPLKNMHTSCECVNLTDIEDCAELLARLCEDFHNCKGVGKIIIK